jgi:hypothetical protein
MAHCFDTRSIAITSSDAPKAIFSYAPPRPGIYHLRVCVLGVCENLVDRMRSLQEMTLFFDGNTISQEGSEYFPIPETKTDETWDVELGLKPTGAVLYARGCPSKRVFWKTAFCVTELGVQDE